jgi:ABC-type multidrug transport system ATPase subunit
VRIHFSYAVEVRGLTKSFGNLQVLKDINLKVDHGECLVLFGPNGAGKTTLVNILATLVKPSSGTALINGIDIKSEPVSVRHYLGFVGHQTFLYDNLSVYDNLKFYGRMYGIDALERRVKEVVERVELESRLYDRICTLSRGMQQRVSWARAIIHNPPLLFLDEPEVGLDSRAVSITSEILNAALMQGATVLLATHFLERGLSLCDRVAILNEGDIVYQASKKEIDVGDFKAAYEHHTGTGI